jgi:hypothetical protein
VQALGLLKELARSALPQVQAAKSDNDAGVRAAAERAERLIDPSLAEKGKKK